ncbi:aspartate dehydrogenase [Fodinicurvata halophila]|uniref:L-aspartate dehydrogenase n=1 Tax=Fodinicurvata halophila TaxID=1419723 RepID=A0ABV8UH26_9PROT
MADTRKIGLIGFGGIGRAFLDNLKHLDGAGRLVSILVRPQYVDGLRAEYAGDTRFVSTLNEFVESNPTLVVECAGNAALNDYGAPLLRQGIDLVAASSGALVDPALYETLTKAARAGQGRIMVPSGAIGAIDALSAMALAGLKTVTYRGIKPVAAWKGTAAEEHCDLDQLQTARVFFQGNARQAAALFPKNANVAAIVGLAGLGLDSTQVELVADPEALSNIHEIRAEATTGSLELRMGGLASSSNARTSALTVFSLLDAVRNNRTVVEIR